MDDLRSLEGVGHLLSEKMAQSHNKGSHKRSTSVPTVTNGSSSLSSQTLRSNYIAISAQFPPQLAAALASGINVGYYQQPKLLKSHSGFVKKNVLQEECDDNKTKSSASGSNVTFVEYQPVVSPQESISPSYSPRAFHGLSLNQTNSNRSSNRSSAHSSNLWNLQHAIPESPSSNSVRLSSLAGGGLQLDLTEVLVDEAITPRTSSSVWHSAPFAIEQVVQMSSTQLGMAVIPSPDAMECATSEETPPPPLKKTYSNNSLFTLYGGEDLSDTEDLVLSNTKLNSQIVPSLPILESGTLSNIELESLNLKEDFMEYQNEQKDAFSNIGMGASGIVRKAFHFGSCKMVAIKECRSKRKNEMNAFIKEAKIYRKFEDDPHIVNILGFGKDSDNGTLAMAMEYMDLGSCDALKINSMTQKEIIVGHIMVKTLSALTELHASLYVHNDIKPGNILCNKYGEIKLSDFGTMLQMKDKHHKLSRNNGTQRYQSPEKMIQEPIAYSTKTDIWSLGVTAYELLFGEQYNMKDELAFCNNPPKLTPKEDAISPECCDFIMKCLEINDEKRESASHLLEHNWFTKHINNIPLCVDKWPWFRFIESEDEKNDINEHKNATLSEAIKPAATATPADIQAKKMKNKKVSFKFPQATDNKRHQIKRHQFYNEDLLFMISALIIYYSSQCLDLNSDKNDSDASLHRRVSAVQSYTDQQRIKNIAKYALCSPKMVVDRIQVTVAFIKAQINKLEKL